MRLKIAVSTIALLAAACSTDEPQMAANDGDDPAGVAAARGEQPGPVFFFGTVHNIPDNGGVWVVRTAGGRQYQPIQLPAEFQVDGLAVEVQALKHDAVVTQDTLGQKIDIVEIRRQGGASD